MHFMIGVYEINEQTSLPKSYQILIKFLIADPNGRFSVINNKF